MFPMYREKKVFRMIRKEADIQNHSFDISSNHQKDKGGFLEELGNFDQEKEKISDAEKEKHYNLRMSVSTKVEKILKDACYVFHYREIEEKIFNRYKCHHSVNTVLNNSSNVIKILPGVFIHKNNFNERFKQEFDNQQSEIINWVRSQMKSSDEPISVEQLATQLFNSGKYYLISSRSIESLIVNSAQIDNDFLIIPDPTNPKKRSLINKSDNQIHKRHTIANNFSAFSDIKNQRKNSISIQPTNEQKVYSDINKFKQYIENAGLSVRATNVLLNKVANIRGFFDLDESKLANFINCGRKTTREILEFQRKSQRKLGQTVPAKAKEEKGAFSLLPKDIKENKQLFESIMQMLSERARNVLIKNEINSLEKFMVLSNESMCQMRNCGTKTIAEVVKYQEKIYKLATKTEKEKQLQSISSDSNLQSTTSIESRRYEPDDIVDLDSPFPSIKKWVSGITQKFLRNSKQTERIFMLRMGMLGKPPMTLEQIGEQFEITRERVRQIVSKIERSGRHPVRRSKLQPLIKRALDIVNSRGGKIKNRTLVSLLLVRGRDGEMLRFATPFIDFLSTFREWKESGLKIGENGGVFTDKFDEIVKAIASVIVKIASENADERINENLWSIDFGSLKRMTNDWFNERYPNHKILELSNVVVNEALSLWESQVKKRGRRIYSYALWGLRHERISIVVEAILRNSKKAMHFSEIYTEIKKHRPDDDSFSENNVHATLDRLENVFLWERGTFIHKTCVSTPYDLINDIERWILDKLREKVPFISVYGPFKFFEQKCQESNIPNETALYSILKELSHPLITYPRLPYIYFNKGRVSRVSTILAVEHFVQDSGGPVSYNELKSFIIDGLFLKDFQFNQIIYEIPNTIRTNDGGFLHTDFINFDVEKFNEIAAYTRKIISKEGHVSVIKIFEDKKIRCKILGLDGPRGLFSLFRILVDDEFDLQSYPKVQFHSSNNSNRKRGILSEVSSYIKEKKSFCTHQELQEKFVDGLGYNETTVYSVRYKENIYSYLKDCLIHKNTIGWNDVKQEQIEKVAFNRYGECVRGGKYYGLIKEMIEFNSLPDLRQNLYWTSYLSADLLVNRGRFKILGSEKNAFVPIPNEFAIENFEDLICEILKNECGGGENLNQFSEKLRELGIIKKRVTENMLGKSQKVRIIGNEIVMSELVNNA